MRSHIVTGLIACAIVLGGSVPAVAAPAAGSGAAAPVATGAGPAPDQLPDVVSQSPVTYTPNFSGHAPCGQLCGNSTVYSTAVVNGEVVVAGAFSDVCSPVSSGFAPCPNSVPANYLVAFNINTGAIDPGFAPVLTNGPVYSVAPGPGDTVYAGGAFTAVNGTTTGGIAALAVDPGQSDDGQLVPGFQATTVGRVNTLAINGSALYLGGAFTAVDGHKYHQIARVNATTGAVDPSFKFTLSQPIHNGLVVNTMSVTPDGTTLAFGGSFLQVNGVSHPRIALISTGGGIGQPATLDAWMAPDLANPCTKQHDYVNGIDFSPDGSFFAVATTGFSGGGICDAVARFQTDATATNAQPAWINFDGGDTLHSVAVVGNVVYVGGHDRWINDYCGDNFACEANVLLVNGLSAIDANTGLALPWWHPQTLRKTGVQSLVPFSAAQDPGTNGGLIVGTDATTIGGAKHDEIAIFPEPSNVAQTPGGPIPSAMFSQGRVNGTEGGGTSSGTAAMCVDDPANSSTPGTVVDFSTCTDGNGQNWTIESGGTIQINGLCLDTNPQNGTLAVVLANCNGSPTQQWAQGAGNTLTNGAGPGLCLDDPGANLANGTALVVDACNGAASQGWPLPVAQAPPPPPPVGSLWPQERQASTNVPCATSATNKPRAGVTKVVLSQCLGFGTQNWTVQANGEIQVFGLCLDTVGGAGTAGTLVDLNTCTGSPSQTWTSSGQGAALIDGLGMCLDDPGSNTANGTDLDISTCSGGHNQQWRLPQV
jgi:hypothetical protein